MLNVKRQTLERNSNNNNFGNIISPLLFKCYMLVILNFSYLKVHYLLIKFISFLKSWLVYNDNKKVKLFNNNKIINYVQEKQLIFIDASLLTIIFQKC